MTRLSVLIVARNEAAHLPGCLASAAFADQIVVLLDRSTDDSAAIAQAAGALVVEGAWALEGPRRMAGIEACAGPWILELDADERVPPSLAEEIRRTLAGSAMPTVWEIPFLNHVGGRPIRYGWGAYNGVGAKACLFTKGAKIWGGGSVHPQVTLNPAPAGRLTQPIHHYVDRDIAAMIARLNRYTDAAAADAFARRARSSLAGSLRRLVTRFWKAYIARGGYREGIYGLALGLFAGLYPLLTHLKLRELQAGAAAPPPGDLPPPSA